MTAEEIRALKIQIWPTGDFMIPHGTHRRGLHTELRHLTAMNAALEAYATLLASALSPALPFTGETALAAAKQRGRDEVASHFCRECGQVVPLGSRHL